MQSTDQPIRQIFAHIDPGTLTGALIYLVIFAVVGAFLSRLFSRAMNYELQHRHGMRDVTGLTFLTQFGRVLIWLAVATLYTHVVPELSRIGTALLAGVSVVSIVVGLAAQSTLSNLVAGISLVIYRPFKVGDRLLVAVPGGTETGEVTSISLGYTALATDDGRIVVVANSQIGNQTVINLSKAAPARATVFDLSLAQGTAIARAMELLREIGSRHAPGTAAPECRVKGLNGDGVDLALTVHIADGSNVDALRSEIWQAIGDRFAQEGLALAPRRIATN